MTPYHVPTIAQISALLEAAAGASGCLQGAAFLLDLDGNTKGAAILREALVKLNAATNAVLGRPVPAVLVPDAIPQPDGENTK